MVLIEAMAAGVPVVAGRDSGATAWTLGGGRAGYLVDISAPEEIAKAALHVLSSADTQQRIATHGLHLVEERHSPEAVVAGYREQYEKALGC